jgi:hypothetical protein
MVVHGNPRAKPEEETGDLQNAGELSSDSNKKLQTVVDKGSADLAGAAQQTRRTQ